MIWSPDIRQSAKNKKMELILNLKYNKIAFCYIQSLNDTMRHYFAAFFIPDIFLVSHGAKCNGLQSMVRFRHVVSANEIFVTYSTESRGGGAVFVFVVPL